MYELLIGRLLPQGAPNYIFASVPMGYVVACLGVFGWGGVGLGSVLGAIWRPKVVEGSNM